MELARIAAITVFAGVPDPELAAVAAAAGELELEAGRTLATEGDFGHALYAIESGSADIVVDRVVVRSVGPGDVVGEIAVLAAGRRPPPSSRPRRCGCSSSSNATSGSSNATRRQPRRGCASSLSRHLAAADTAS